MTNHTNSTTDEANTNGNASAEPVAANLSAAFLPAEVPALMAPALPATHITIDANDEQVAKFLAERTLLTKHLIAQHQVDILKKITSLEKLGEEPDYELSIRTILKELGKTTIGQLGAVMGDTKALNQARKRLLEQGLIIEINEGSRKLLELAPQNLAA